MSFKCSQCSSSQASGVKPVVVILQTRPISYPVRYRNGVVIDRGGNGTAIVREGKFCKQCAAQQGVQPTIATAALEDSPFKTGIRRNAVVLSNRNSG